jgi:hypothetical protein
MWLFSFGKLVRHVSIFNKLLPFIYNGDHGGSDGEADMWKIEAR